MTYAPTARIACVFTGFLLSTTAWAEPSSLVAGRILARGTRAPIAGAAVIADDGPVAEAGADGTFSLPLAPGSHALTVKAAGFESARLTEEVAAGQRLDVVYRLTPLASTPYESTVRAAPPRDEVSRVALAGAELREVPGTMGDPFRVVMLMPGVASIGSGAGYPVVRGSPPASTGYFLDGVRLPMLFHLLLGPAVVHPELLGGLDFQPGAAPVPYGRITGGAIDAHLAKPRTDRVHATATLDLVNAGGLVEGQVGESGPVVTLAGRYAYSGLVAGLLAEAVARPGAEAKPSYGFRLWDTQLRLEQKFESGTLRVLGLTSQDTIATSGGEANDFQGELGVGFSRLDVRWKQRAFGGRLEAAVTGGEEHAGVRVDDRGSPVGAFSLGGKSVSARLGYARDLSDELVLESGADVERRWSTTTVSGVAEQVGDRGVDPSDALRRPSNVGTVAGAWGQLVWTPGPWTVAGGLRADSWHLAPDVFAWAVEPRLAVRRTLSEAFVVKGGAGLYHQPPTVLLQLPALDLAGLPYGLQTALQFDVGGEWHHPSGLEISADVYVNPLLHAVEFSLVDLWENRRRVGAPAPEPSTSGLAAGFELLVRKPLTERWFGWLSYGYQRSTRRMTFSRYAADGTALGQATADVPFAFEQRHVVNGALSYRLAKWTLGITLHFNSGRPETGQITSRSHHAGENADGTPIWVRDDLDQAGRLDPFFRADLRIERSFVFDAFLMDAYLDVFNASLQSEVLGNRYFTTDDGIGTPPRLEKVPFALPIVLPVIGVKGTF